MIEFVNIDFQKGMFFLCHQILKFLHGTCDKETWFVVKPVYIKAAVNFKFRTVILQRFLLWKQLEAYHQIFEKYGEYP